MTGSTLLVACLLAACHPQLPADQEQPLEVALSHTILLKDPGCTGVRLGGGLVATAKHCINERVLGDEYSGFKLGYISPDHDFVVMEGDEPIDSVWLLDARIGEHLYVVGYPGSIDDGNQHLTVTDGVYTGVTSEDMERITAYAYYGNSGGGVWGDGGSLLGILVEIRPAGEGLYGVLPMPAHSDMVPIRFVRSIVLPN